MSAPNPHWTRWIISSVADHFKTNVATPLTLPFLVEGLDDRNPAFEQAPDRAELRINGPFTQELSKNYWRLWVDVNILVTSNYDGAVKNRYTLEINTGKFHEFADTCISVFRHGDIAQTPENDGTLLGRLLPRTGKNDSVRSIHFGQLNKVDKLKQSQVDARYVMYLCTNEN
jgi:hypothetical protein